MQSFVESVLGSPDSKALTAYFQPVACTDAPSSQSRQLGPWKFANNDRFDAGIIMSGMICDHGPGFGIVAHTASVCSFGTEAMVFKTSKILADVYRAMPQCPQFLAQFQFIHCLLFRW